MRWDRLFADLEGQASAIEQAELEAEIADRSRVELGQMTLLNRIRAHQHRQLRLTVAGVGRLDGELGQVGADWLLLTTPAEVVVPLAAVLAIADLPSAAVSPEGVGQIASRLRLTAALRAVAQDRCAVTLTLQSGGTLTGTPDRVGADFFDLALHEIGEAPRRTAIRARTTVPFGAIGAVRRNSDTWG